MDPNMIDDWGGGPAKMDDNVDTEFTLWSGDIHGKNTEVIPNKKLVQEWFGGDWENPSIVTFALKEKGNTTELTLLHEDVPDNEAVDIADGWKSYYLGPMKELLEQII